MASQSFRMIKLYFTLCTRVQLLSMVSWKMFVDMSSLLEWLVALPTKALCPEKISFWVSGFDSASCWRLLWYSGHLSCLWLGLEVSLKVDSMDFNFFTIEVRLLFSVFFPLSFSFESSTTSRTSYSFTLSTISSSFNSTMSTSSSPMSAAVSAPTKGCVVRIITRKKIFSSEFRLPRCQKVHERHCREVCVRVFKKLVFLFKFFTSLIFPYQNEM